MRCSLVAQVPSARTILIVPLLLLTHA